jgi:DNA repair exonuclease SbcCD ATPase subunit
MNDIEQAEKTLAGLKQKREALVARGHSLGEAQGRISYSAHTGDKAARAKLDKLNAEAALHDSELRSLDSAIAEATARVERARQAEAQAQGRGVARELLKRAARLVELAQSLDDAAAIRVECSRVISEELQTMRQIAHGLGVFVPSEQQFLSLGERAERTTLMETPFHRIAERLGPTERRTHMSYAVPWSEAIAKGCAALLGEEETEAA